MGVGHRHCGSLAYAAGALLLAGIGPRNAFTVAAVGAALGALILLIGLRAREESRPAARSSREPSTPLEHSDNPPQGFAYRRQPGRSASAPGS